MAEADLHDTDASLGLEPSAAERSLPPSLETQIQLTNRELLLVRLNPEEIRTTGSNRLPQALDPDSDPEFEAFAQDILQCAGNKEPVRVRYAQRHDDDPAPWELISGHRRHAACHYHGLQLLALITNIDDAGLLLDRLRENLQRQSLSPYEQAQQYHAILDGGFVNSMTELAQELNVDKGNLSRTLDLLKLPQRFWELFADRRMVPCDPARQVLHAWQSNQEAVDQRLSELHTEHAPIEDKKVMRAALRELIAAAKPTQNGADDGQADTDQAAEQPGQEDRAVQGKRGETLFTVRSGEREVQLALPVELWSEKLQDRIRQLIEAELESSHQENAQEDRASGNDEALFEEDEQEST